MADEVRLERKTIRLVLEQCQRTLELLKTADDAGGRPGDGGEAEADPSPAESLSSSSSLSLTADSEADQLCELLKCKVESEDFLEKLGSIHMSVSQNVSVPKVVLSQDDCTSWDLISSKDSWEDKNTDAEQDDFVLVSKEDTIEAIACFMAAYLLSLKETKDLTPNQLQKALSKTFSVKGKKSKIRKAWDGSIVVYNVASWGATVFGMYQNPAILKAASGAIWSSCHVISKLF